METAQARYLSVALTSTVVTELRETAAVASGTVRQRVTQSETVAAMLRLVKDFPGEFATAVAEIKAGQ